jgi:hypothetical protein
MGAAFAAGVRVFLAVFGFRDGPFSAKFCRCAVRFDVPISKFLPRGMQNFAETQLGNRPNLMHSRAVDHEIFALEAQKMEHRIR